MLQNPTLSPKELTLSRNIILQSPTEGSVLAKHKDVAFGLFIQARRAERGLSGQAAARKAGISPTTWRSMEAGATLRKDTLARVASALELNVDALLARQLGIVPTHGKDAVESNGDTATNDNRGSCYYCDDPVPFNGWSLRRLDGKTLRVRREKLAGETNDRMARSMSQDGSAPDFFFCSLECLARRAGENFSNLSQALEGRGFQASIEPIGLPEDSAPPQPRKRRQT